MQCKPIRLVRVFTKEERIYFTQLFGLWAEAKQENEMVAFGFFRKCGSTSARFLRRISYLLYGDILFWSAFETDLHFLAGVNEELVVVQKRQQSMLLRCPRYPRRVLDGRIICMCVFRDVIRTSWKYLESRSWSLSFCFSAIPRALKCEWFEPWGWIECRLISRAGNYQSGRVLECVHFNRKQVQTEEEPVIYWCVGSRACSWRGTA